MKYFSGFSLQNEASLFEPYLIDDAHTVAGFSYGAQQALEYVYASSMRIDRLILLSPAFFQRQKVSFVRAQLRYFESDMDAYMKQFLKNVSYPSDVDLRPYLCRGTKDELHALLSYVWKQDKIETVLARGTTIEVFMGAKDKIVDTAQALQFFTQTTNYTVKDAGHLLCTIEH